MATAPPPYPGFNPYVVPGSAPYPQQPSPPAQQLPQGQDPSKDDQQDPYTRQQYLPGQQCPSPGQQPSPGVHNAGFAPCGPPPMPMPIHIPNDVELKGDADAVELKGELDNIPGWTNFTDKAIQAMFIRKVYAIIMLQLLVTLVVITLFVFEKNCNRFVKHHTYLIKVSYFVFAGVYIYLGCFENLRRKYPTNMIFLSIFTLSLSYMLGAISSFYDSNVVLLAVGICAGVCLGVSLFSFHSKFDFTSCGGVLFILLWVLFLFGIIAIFTRNQIMTTVYSGAGALLFTLFLAYDTQMLTGGKKYKISPEEYIFAAMQIYLDIAYIFLYILSGSGKK